MSGEADYRAGDGGESFSGKETRRSRPRVVLARDPEITTTKTAYAITNDAGEEEPRSLTIRKKTMQFKPRTVT